MNKMRIAFIYQIKSETRNDFKNPPVCDIIMLKFEINRLLSNLQNQVIYFYKETMMK